MKFLKLIIRKGILERTVDFSRNSNLIHSSKNSCGKTLLLRLVLYSLGYNIPEMKNFKFSECLIQVELECDNKEIIKLKRSSSFFVELERNNTLQTFVLPSQQFDLHSLIFQTNNIEILTNILGAFYVDQEKGWTLLNRGIVIGSIRFNIEELIRGLSGRDCRQLLEDEKRISKELAKYRLMSSVAKYRESIIEESGDISSNSYKESTDIEINQLLIQQKLLNRELKRIDQALANNRQFKKFVSEMKLLIEIENGNCIPVTENNIVGLSDSIDFLIAKRGRTALELAKVTSQLESLQNQEKNEIQQLAFFASESLIETFDKKISSFPINAKSIEKEITKLEKNLKNIRKKIHTKTIVNNDVVNSMYNSVLKYATELGIGDARSIADSYLFTSNLKELSGAVLHKTVFAFRLAYIIEIEKLLKIKLPIIIDSPTGKELDQTNVQLLINILKRDFSENQIIIASIHKYDFEKINIIELSDHLLHIK